MENKNNTSFYQFSDQLRVQTNNLANLSLNDSIWSTSYGSKKPETRKNFDIRVGGGLNSTPTDSVSLTDNNPKTNFNGFNHSWKIESPQVGSQFGSNSNGSFNKGVYSKPSFNFNSINGVDSNVVGNFKSNFNGKMIDQEEGKFNFNLNINQQQQQQFHGKSVKKNKNKINNNNNNESGSKIGFRKQNIVFVDAPVTESSCHVDERWFDADKKIPLSMKRKGLASGKTSQEAPMFEKAKKIKSKTDKKCSTTSVQQNDGKQDKAGDDDSNSTNHNMNVDKKTSKTGGAIMEGSRCSRVNGRGWRCSQQTLVGYSLCEHHLGKGRLRSIVNVKGRAKIPTAAAPTTAPHSDSTDVTTNDEQPAKKVLVSSSVVQPARDCNKESILLYGSSYDDEEDKEEDKDDEDYSDQEMKKALLVKKKRMKLGTVKARSLSSLLNQTNNAVLVAADDN